MEPGAEETKPSLLIRILAVVGIIIVLFLGMWLSVTVASKIPDAFSGIGAALSSFTSIFVSNDEKIVVTNPSTVASGETFRLSWTHEKKDADGSYTFRYDCAPGVHFVSPDSLGRPITIFCNVPFNFLNANNGIILTAYSDQNRLIDATLYIDFTPNGIAKPTVTGQAELTIANQNQGVITPPATTTPQNPPAKPATTTPPTNNTGNGGSTIVVPTVPVSDPNGYVDLTGRILEIGLINTQTRTFTALQTPPRTPPFGYQVGIRFRIENTGTKTSPGYYFTATLPTSPSYLYTSSVQNALTPKAYTDFTLGFDQFGENANGLFTLSIDPNNFIAEPNESNNSVNYLLTVY